MVDFNKLLNTKETEKKANPIEIYESLDRASDKGPLRPAQSEILEKWFTNYIDKKDTIIKLSTGEGKTLIGLLILQSLLNQNKGPALYLCPDHYLVKQTCIQAEQFGIEYCLCDSELPSDFENGKKILITTVNKMFNGLTKFGLDSRSIPVSSIIFDDAHSSLEIIKNCFTINISRTHALYKDLLTLLKEDLIKQGTGTAREIFAGDYSALLPIPYWVWQDKQTEIIELISKYKDDNVLKFNWPLLKNKIKECICVISGDNIEIAPYLIPINTFGSFVNAANRIYMSATINNDSFFIKHLNVSADTIKNPITYSSEKCSGEKMILIPSLIDQRLTDDSIVELFAHGKSKNNGICVLIPSFNKHKNVWESHGATIANKDNIETLVENLKKLNIIGNQEETDVIVFANRYDGIDLPDKACRILIFHGKPFTESNIERYIEDCLANTDLINIKQAQKIEQGLGRHIRGEKDFGVVLILGADLISFIRLERYQKYFSAQTKQQIETGIKISNFARSEVEEANQKPVDVLINTITKSLKRDDAWKNFYKQEMDNIKTTIETGVIDMIELEREAETLYLNGCPEKATKLINEYITANASTINNTEKGWYLQEMARYEYSLSKQESIRLQQSAHSQNNYLLKPIEGIKFHKLDSFQGQQAENIKNYLQKFKNFEELCLLKNELVANLYFGGDFEKFENSLCEIGKLLGFASERPDKQWSMGPDNLWQVGRNQYVLFECKNQVLEQRAYINKDESSQMNTSCAWFDLHYNGAECLNILIIPTNKVGPAAAFSKEVLIMKNNKLKLFKENLDSFIKEFSTKNLSDLSIETIASLIKLHKLESKDFQIYGELPEYIRAIQ